MRKTTLSLIVIASLLSGCAIAPQIQESKPEDIPDPKPLLEETVSVELEPDLFEPWSETFSRKSLGYAVLENTENYFNNNYTKNCEWSPMAYSPDAIENLESLQLVMDQTVNTFCEQLEDDPIVIISPYYYVKELLPELGRPTDDHGGICGGPDSGGNTGCALYHNSWVSSVLKDEDQLLVTAHEMFHNVQDSVNKGVPFWKRSPSHELYVPMWFIEGSAVTYQSAMIDYLKLGSGRYFDYGFGSPMLQASPDTAIDLASLEQCCSMDTYVVGQFATEYIVANVGLEPLLDVIAEVGEGKTFAVAFEQEIGISMEEFYVKMGQIQLLED